MNAIIKKHYCFWIVMACCLSVSAQDSLTLSLPKAEQLFFQRNLSLLAERYNVSISEALVVQARLWNNPNIEWDGNLYNPAQKKVLDLSNRTGQYTVTAQQLILLAGKRNKQVQLASTNTLRASDQFFELMRTLRYSLRSSFYQAFFLLNSMKSYNRQIASLEKLNQSYQELGARGVVTMKEVIRIQSLLYSLRSEWTLLQNQFHEVQGDLQLLLQDNSHLFIPQVPDGNPREFVSSLRLQDLLDSANNNRYDLSLARHDLLYSRQNLSLQKSLAVPDLTLGVQFDKRGSFVDNATFFTMAIDLPFFNRNQGNIKVAKYEIEQATTLSQQKRMSVENEVSRAYATALENERMMMSVDPSFRSRFDELITQVTLNFEKRNISLLEFVDFYDSYKQTILQLNQVENARYQSLENLYFAIGKPLLTN